MIREGLPWSDLLTPRSGTGCKQVNIYDTITVIITVTNNYITLHKGN